MFHLTKNFLAAELARILPHAEYAEMPYIGKGTFADCYDLGEISAAAPAQPEGWDSLWLSDCSAKVEWSSTDEE